MVIVLVTEVATLEGQELVPMVEQGFRAGGAEVERIDAHALLEFDGFRGVELVVYLTDELRLGGGPGLRQVASRAQESVVPVIALAGQCRISTRELRTLGVEAGYAVGDAGDVRRVVQTWTPLPVSGRSD